MRRNLLVHCNVSPINSIILLFMCTSSAHVCLACPFIQWHSLSRWLILMSKHFATKNIFSCKAHEVSLDNCEKFIVFCRLTPSCSRCSPSCWWGKMARHLIYFVAPPLFNNTFVGKCSPFLEKTCPYVLWLTTPHSSSFCGDTLGLFNWLVAAALCFTH